jgi:tetratricopeptide (TPR) repeat protein
MNLMSPGKIYFFIVLCLIVLTAVSVKSSDTPAVYTVHCASYQMAGKASDDVQKLVSLGYPAFYSEVEIKGKGKWFRVYAGKFDNKKKAILLAETLKKNKLVSDYLIFNLSTYNLVPPKQDKKLSITPLKKKKSPTVETKDVDKSTQKPPALIEEKYQAKNERAKTAIKEIDEPSSGHSLYDQALSEMKQKNYLKALATLKEFIAREDTKNEWGERALRHMADCHYYLGEKGSKDNLLFAVEFYKNILQSFPDPKKENASTYYRLAKTYDYLKFYPESIKNYEYLISKYTNSSYASEAAFRIGELNYKNGKHNQAIEKLTAYLIKNRGGDYAKQAFYLIADCYYKTKQSASAEVWFRDAQKKWPDLIDIPEEVIMDLGVHKYSLRRYDEAINAFSFYANMNSKDEKLKEVLMLLANSYKAADQISAALTILNLIIDKYPESKEATESIMLMATLGLEKPGVKVVSSLNNINYYKQPIDAYDTILMKNPAGEIAESATLKKADALQKLQRNKKAADIYLEFLNMYPQSKMADEARAGFKKASAGLIDDYFAKKDYLAVAYIYFKAYKAVPVQADEYKQLSKIALSLKELGLTEDYLNLLTDYKKVGKDEQILNSVMLDIAEGQMAQAKYDEAQKTLDELISRPSVKGTGLIAEIRKNQATISYRKGLYDKAISNYDAVVRSGQNIKDPAQAYSQYASSLNQQKENSLALQNYLIAVKYFNQDKNTDANQGAAYKEIGDLYFKAKNFQSGLEMYTSALNKSTDPELKSWSQYYIGKSYLKMDKNVDAQKTFTEIKNQSGPDGFWTKVVDYYVEDQKWWEKYGERLKK